MLSVLCGLHVALDVNKQVTVTKKCLCLQNTKGLRFFSNKKSITRNL